MRQDESEREREVQTAREKKKGLKVVPDRHKSGNTQGAEHT